MLNLQNSYYVKNILLIFVLVLIFKNITDMKIYCLDCFTDISDYCGLSPRCIVSTKSAIENYVTLTKERILKVLSHKPYLRTYPVYVSVYIKEPNNNHVFSVVSHYTIVLNINCDDSFKRTLKYYAKNK